MFFILILLLHSSVRWVKQSVDEKVDEVLGVSDEGPLI